MIKIIKTRWKHPITKWDDLKVNTDYEGRCKLTFNGITYEGNRASIDEGKLWKDELFTKKHKSIKVVMVDACACFIHKSTPFKLWLN